MPPQSPSPQNTPPGQYDFITEPSSSTGGSPLVKLPGTGSKLGRVILVGCALIVLFIVFGFVKGLLSGPGLTPYVGIVQDQQALIHIMDGVTQQQTSGQPGLSTNDQNFAVTADVSLTSAKAQLVKYLTKNKAKLSPKILNLKVSTSIDQQLATAVAAGTYDQTFKDIARSKLTAYSTDLQRVFRQVKGAQGKALLQSDYAQAQLLLVQLDTPSN